MIASFRHRGLEELFRKGQSTKVSPDLPQRYELTDGERHIMSEEFCG